MKLLIITQYFPPEMGAPQARLSELAIRLRDKGWTITVLTAMPNYPTGRVFDGYRWRLRMTEEIDGLRVVRTCLFPSKSSRALPRLLSYISFVCTSVVLGIWGLGRQDVVLFESPPLFLIPAGLVIGRLTRGRIIMNCSDIWPDQLVLMGRLSEGLSLKLLRWLERFGYEHSDAVTVTNPGAVQDVKGRFPHVPVAIISNGVDTKLFRPDLRSDAVRASLGAGPDDFLAGYCGLHGLAQGLEVILDAAERLRDLPRIKFVLIGDGPTRDDLIQMAGRKQLTNVTFLDRRPKKEMPPILASCEVSLVPLVARLPGVMPSKVYEALASGAPPIVAKGCEGDPLVTQFDAGRTFEPMHGNELAEAVRELADHPDIYRRVRANGLTLSRRFDRDAIAERTDVVLRAVAEGRPLAEVAW